LNSLRSPAFSAVNPAVRTALIGCGKVGGIHAQALASLPESNFVDVCDAQLSLAE